MKHTSLIFLKHFRYKFEFFLILKYMQNEQRGFTIYNYLLLNGIFNYQLVINTYLHIVYIFTNTCVCCLCVPYNHNALHIIIKYKRGDAAADDDVDFGRIPTTYIPIVFFLFFFIMLHNIINSANTLPHHYYLYTIYAFIEIHIRIFCTQGIPENVCRCSWCGQYAHVIHICECGIFAATSAQYTTEKKNCIMVYVT